MTLKDEIKFILNEIDRACEEANTAENPSPDMLLDCAVRIYNSQHISSRQSGVSETSLYPPCRAPAGQEPATDKQIHLMKKLGLEYKTGMTKKEANALISEKLGKK